MKIFFDTEFTGLHADTTLISIGMASDCGKVFYAELTDYDQLQVDDWLQKNVIDNLVFNNEEPFVNEFGSILFVKGSSELVRKELLRWLNQFGKVELWSDVCHYDMVLFQGIFGGAFSVPEHVDYICYDISTVFKMFSLDPDMSREAFIDTPISGKKHNALYDAKVIRACYDKLRRNQEKYPVVI